LITTECPKSPCIAAKPKYAININAVSKNMLVVKAPECPCCVFILPHGLIFLPNSYRIIAQVIRFVNPLNAHNPIFFVYLCVIIETDGVWA